MTISVFEKLSYASGGVGTCICFMSIGGYLLYVYTDVFGLSATTAANIFLLTRFWDAINDPIMGAVVDLRLFAKKSRGVYRPLDFARTAVPCFVFHPVLYLALLRHNGI